MVAGFDAVEELDHFLVEKLYAAAAGWGADLFFVIRAVDVDVAGVGIVVAALVVAGLQSFQPEDAGGDEVWLLLLFAELPVAFSDIEAPFEEGAERGVLADLLGDPVETGRGAEGIFQAARGIAAGGDLEFVGEFAVCIDFEGLLLERYEQEARCLLDLEGAELMGGRLQ